ncbi:NADH-cytochrome b5 reductase [Coemansia sp. RSA 720]|nr:NADH-cytochrome b5 reductase [Coemansia sp. RSA 720]
MFLYLLFFFAVDEQLEQRAADHEGFVIYYVLSNSPVGWTGGVGSVSKEIIQEHLPTPADGVKVLLCGPPPMVKAMGALLGDLGYESPRAISKPDDQVFKF